MTDSSRIALKNAARSIERARSRLRYAMETAQLAALDALEAGATEVEVAEALGVNRLTVRKWAGK